MTSPGFASTPVAAASSDPRKAASDSPDTFTVEPRRIREEAGSDVGVPFVRHPEWSVRYPWLIQGITHREDPRGGEFDLGVGGSGAVGEVLGRWERLRSGLGVRGAAVSPQVHGATIRLAREPVSGVQIGLPGDGHLTSEPDLILAVSVADCVPVYLVDPLSRTLALLHAGWRGVAAGVVEAGVRSLRDRFGLGAADLQAHLGPSISGTRYPVGPEVPVALGMPDPGGQTRLDLVPHIAWRLERAGIARESITASSICVHDDPRFFSHRGGDRGRQMAFLGFRGRPGVR